MACLYSLTSPSGHQYIGIAKDANKRWAVHKSAAKTTNSQSALYQAIRKYGFDSFEKKILVIGEFDYVKELEPKAIIAFNTKKPNGYNLTDGGDGTVGYKMSDETKALIAEKTRTRMQNPESILLLRNANLGKQQSAETNKKKGRPGVPSGMLGKTHSEETRQRISQSLVGNAHTKGHTLSDEHKRKVSEAMKGRQFSEETRKKMSLASKGRIISEETRRKISIARRKYHALKTQQLSLPLLEQ